MNEPLQTALSFQLLGLRWAYVIAQPSLTTLHGQVLRTNPSINVSNFGTTQPC